MNTIQFIYGILVMILGIVMFHRADSMIDQLWGIGLDIAGTLIIGISFSESKQEK